jgi:hypothetical protein
MPETG